MDITNLPEDERDIAVAAIKAMKAGLCLQFSYDGLPRLCEVHAVGVSTAGRACMRVFQVQGDSVSNQPVGWKMMSLGKVFEPPLLLDIMSSAPRDGYNRGDKGMTDIFDEI